MISFAAIFLSVAILVNLLGWVVKFLFKKTSLGWLDRTLGACLAITKGIFLIYIILIMITFFIPTRAPLIAESILAPWVIKSYQSVTSLISPDHYQRWKRKIVGEQKKIGEIFSEKKKDMEKKHE